MLELALSIKILLFGAGLLAGTIDAIAGGGGLITLPLLINLGMPISSALGTNKLQAAIGTTVATHHFFKKKLISLQTIVKGLAFGLIGASLGALLAQYISSTLLEKILPILLLSIFTYTLYTPKLGLIDSHQRMSEHTFYIVFGFILGFYDGFLGPGTGSFWVISLIYFLGYNLAKATAYTKVLNLNSNLIATTWFIIGGNIDYRIALIMAAGQFIGGKLGSHLVVKNGAALVKPIFLIVVFFTLLAMFYKSYLVSMNIEAYLDFRMLLIAIAMLVVISSIVIRYLKQIK